MTWLVTTCFSGPHPRGATFFTADSYPHVSQRVPGQPFHVVRMVDSFTEDMSALDLGPFLLDRAVDAYAPGARTKSPVVKLDGLEPGTQIEICEAKGLHYTRFQQGDAVIFCTLVMPEGSA